MTTFLQKFHLKKNGTEPLTPVWNGNPRSAAEENDRPQCPLMWACWSGQAGAFPVIFGKQTRPVLAQVNAQDKNRRMGSWWLHLGGMQWQAIDEKSVREGAQQHVSVFGECPEETSMEVNEKHLTKEELAEFQSAKAIEVTAFLAAKAFEALPPDLKPDMSQVVKMRWVLALETPSSQSAQRLARFYWDFKIQNTQKELPANMAPTTSRLTRQLQLQISASKGFRLWKGDVNPDELFCLPCPEIFTSMGLPTTALTRVKPACYGLVGAPLEWYRSVSAALQKLGLTRTTWSAARFLPQTDMSRESVLLMLTISSSLVQTRIKNGKTYYRPSEQSSNGAIGKPKRLPNAECKRARR